jgi:hypothetical protein
MILVELYSMVKAVMLGELLIAKLIESFHNHIESCLHLNRTSCAPSNAHCGQEYF